MELKGVEIVCGACGAETLLRREPVYDGFRKTGETLSCMACGHVFASEAEVVFKGRGGTRVFTESDRVRKPQVFTAEDRERRSCRHCANYVKNPFVARCSLHKRFVEAMDTCEQWEKGEREGVTE